MRAALNIHGLRGELTEKELRKLTSPRERICSGLYWIMDDEGNEIQFIPNDEQVALLDNLWYLNIVLKARQIGFTTLIVLLGFDHCLFNDNQVAQIIAHRLEDARKIFRNKVQFAYKKLPQWLRNCRGLQSDTTSELVFDNGSSISVSTSARSGTLQFLHVSEYGYICAKHPEKAQEIKTGSLNAIAKNQFVFVESTAYGQFGDFFDMCDKADKHAQANAEMTPLDFRLHFFPWWVKPAYRIESKNVPIPNEYQVYFEKLLVEHGIKLDAEQKAWYVKKAESLGDATRREFPSTAKEAFEVAIEGAYYAKQMAYLRQHGRIRSVPHVPSMPVNTYWDLGRNDSTAIWFHQYVATEHRFFDYYEASGEHLAHYVTVLQNRGYLYGRHYLPHDAENENLEHGISRVDRFKELGIDQNKIVVVPKVDDINDGIEATRKMLPLCNFDQEKCSDGIKALDSYQHEWDEKFSRWRDHPLRNWASHGADAFRQFAQGWHPEIKSSTRKRSRKRSWRTA